jgi:hypothetical protein
MRNLSAFKILLVIQLFISCHNGESVKKLPDFANISFKVQDEIHFGNFETAKKFDSLKEYKSNYVLLLTFVCYPDEKDISHVSIFYCNRRRASCTIRSDSIFIDFSTLRGTKALCSSSLGYYRSFLDTTTYIYRNDTLFLKSTSNDTLILLKHERK